MSENPIEFKLSREFIELDNLLKVISIVLSTAEAKKFIQAGLVKVNGSVEAKVRRKLRNGDIVELQDNRILII